MNRNHGFPDLEPEEMFDEAVERLEAGEPADQIVSSYPVTAQNELRDMLMIVQVAEKMHQVPVPRPSPAKRLTAKQNFLNAAAEMRRQRQPLLQPDVIQQARPRTVIPAHTSWTQRMLETMQGVFTVRTLRLAPMIVMLALVLFSTSTLVTMAQTSVPGDLAYSFKQWIRKQELELAPADRREFVRLAHEQELADDVKRAAARADNNSAIIQDEDTLVFYERMGRLLKIGGLTVMDRYQPDANAELFEPMRIEGDLVPGAQVNLIYQIMPGQSDTVQGIALKVVAPPLKTPTPEPAVITVPDVQPREASCTITQPKDWVLYDVRPGDNLTYMAKRGDTTVEELMQVNCLESETILIGAQLYVPQEALATEKSVHRCGAEMPEEWVEYEVRVGDNLSVLAEQGGSTVQELMDINCLKSETILIGATLYVPEGSVSEDAP